MDYFQWHLFQGVHLVDDAEASTSTQPTASTNSSRSTTSSISTSSSPADSEPSPPLPNQTHQTPNHQNQTKLQVDPTNFSDRLEVAGRTAICVVGGLRSFTLPKIYQSILKFKAKVDPATVFLVMHETASLGHDTRKQVPFKVGKQSLKAAVDALQPVHVEVHSDRDGSPHSLPGARMLLGAVACGKWSTWLQWLQIRWHNPSKMVYMDTIQRTSRGLCHLL
ncbi:unnamed protein product [Durusdinium trenchii]|uniref:Uncharacterized protein n=1 Tax=Durusdinium trenchii TaxID=1381693 RepID=A0ABP0SJA4_9DINO